MCTEMVPILHTRENFVPDLHMCEVVLMIGKSGMR